MRTGFLCTGPNGGRYFQAAKSADLLPQVIANAKASRLPLGDPGSGWEYQFGTQDDAHPDCPFTPADPAPRKEKA